MHSPISRAAILLSAYGSSPFFADQVKSICNQMDDSDTLVIVDDGSYTVNWESIKDLPKKFIFWTRIDRLGASRSFVNLIIEADVHAQYYFLADQDDLWFPNKLKIQVEHHEASSYKAHATIHAWNLVLPKADSASANDVMRPLQQLSPAHYCFETPAPGMTLSFNCECRNQLIESREILECFAESMPHDRIVIGFLSLFACVETLPQPLVAYRQHSSNLVGAHSTSWHGSWLKRLRFPVRTWRTATQGRSFYLTLMRAKNPESFEFKELERTSSMQLRSRQVDNWLVRCMLRLLDKLDKIKRPSE